MSTSQFLGKVRRLSQEQIVIGLSLLFFMSFGVGIKGFLRPDNVLSLVQNVALLGILGIGMSFAIIGRGIDLSMIAVMAMSVAWSLSLVEAGRIPGFLSPESHLNPPKPA